MATCINFNSTSLKSAEKACCRPELKWVISESQQAQLVISCSCRTFCYVFQYFCVPNYDLLRWSHMSPSPSV
jgi:hypothetical protein